MDSRHDEKERIRQLVDENRQLADRLQEQADQLQQQAARIQELEAELQRLQKLLAGKADAKAANKPVFKENSSLDRNERPKKRKRRGGTSSGRRPKEQKREIIASECDVYPAGAGPQECIFHREQFAWRLINGQAVYVTSDTASMTCRARNTCRCRQDCVPAAVNTASRSS